MSELGVKNSLIEANKKDVMIEIKFIERSGRSERLTRKEKMISTLLIKDHE